MAAQRKTVPTVQINVRLPPAVYSALCEKADRTGDTMTGLIVAALRQMLGVHGTGPQEDAAG